MTLYLSGCITKERLKIFSRSNFQKKGGLDREMPRNRWGAGQRILQGSKPLDGVKSGVFFVLLS